MQKYTETKTLKTYQMDRHGIWRPIMLMNELQSVADTHAEQLGRGRAYCEDNAIAWVVTHYLIEIDEMPHDRQEIMISTWPSGIDGIRAFRDFQITDAKTGASLVRATSQWVMIDADARKPLRLDDALAGWEIWTERALNREFDKFPDFVSDTSVNIVPRFDDVDVNQHINNAVYAVWATEALGFDFRDTHRLIGLSINFKKEVKAGTPEIIVESMLDGAVSRHLIRAGDEINAVAVCEWEEIN